MKKLFAVIAGFISLFGFAQNTELFDQGINHYKEGNFEQAIAVWESILENGEHSSTLYYNLGNAYFKNEQVAPSIYFYEKALQLDPADKDILNNLAHAQNRVVDDITPAPDSFFESLYHSVIGLFSFNGWAVLSVVFAFLFALFFMWYYYAIASSKKRIAFSLMGFSLMGTGLALILAMLSYNHFENSKVAIIFAESTQIRSEPLMRSEVSFLLHEGTKVKIKDTDNDWVRVEIADGKEGWMLQQDLKAL